VSVLICTLNEAQTIRWVLERIPPWVDEILIVNGHSTDGTIEVAKTACPLVRVLLQPGKGKGDALRYGFSHATGDIIVTIDADGQNDPAELRSMIDPILSEGFDLVKGSRFKLGIPREMPWHRVLGNWFLATTASLLYGVRFTDVCSGFNAFPRTTLGRIRYETMGPHDYELVLYFRAIRAGLRIREVGNIDRGRIAGESKMPSWHTGWNNLKIIFRERV